MRRARGDLRMQPKTEVDLPEMSVACEDIADAEVLHDDHAGEIDKGDVWFIVVFLPHLPGAAELRRGNMASKKVPASTAARTVLIKL